MANVHVPTWEKEDEYWRGAFRSRPYSTTESTYDDWRPAYRFGYDCAVRYQGRRWDDALEEELSSDWDVYPERKNQQWSWQRVKDAVRDSWTRLTVTK
jgi:hypothetical protein